jgi:hypothetical protein
MLKRGNWFWGGEVDNGRGELTLKNLKLVWAAVAHAYNLTTQQAEIRKITVQSQPWQIVLETLS